MISQLMERLKLDDGPDVATNKREEARAGRPQQNQRRGIPKLMLSDDHDANEDLPAQERGRNFRRNHRGSAQPQRRGTVNDNVIPRDTHGRLGGGAGHRGSASCKPRDRVGGARNQTNDGNGKHMNERHQNRFMSAERAKPRNHPKERQVDILNFRRMRNYETSEPAHILLSLGHGYSGLRELLNLPRQEPDMVKLTLSVIAKACKCESSPQNLHSVLMQLPDSMFFTIGVSNVLMEINVDTEDDDVSRKIIIDLCDILRQLYIRVPGTCAALIGVTKVLEEVVDHLRSTTDVIDEQVMNSIDEVKELQQIKFKKMKERQAPTRNKALDEEELGPPDNFRDIPLLPTIKDLDPNAVTFLRKNKVHGSYVDVDNYLDVQFRLLREDFIQPLRNGICEYKTIEQGLGKRGQRPQNLRIYTDVSIVRSVCSRTDLLHRLHFDTSKLKNVKWAISKRLIYGSLVCLSSDDFRSFYIATVSDRDPKKICDGYIDVKFEHRLEEINLINMDSRFVMVETTAYFEAYRHVLKGLQKTIVLPFEKYIVHCQSSVNPPRYLRDNPVFDLRPLVDENVKLREDSNLRSQGRKEAYNFSRRSAAAENINVMNRQSWPGHELLNVDESQYNALQTALTKEFSVIQGPPGTGKTYVGLKIVKALLHNSKNVGPLDGINRPMLIVCYTNHALDQFLEGILEFYKENIVRVGGRICSDVLQKYSLKSWKQKAREGGRFKDLGRLGFIHGDKLQMLHSRIESVGQRIEAAEGDILTEDTLRPFMSDDHSAQLEITHFRQMYANLGIPIADNISVMVEWLGILTAGEPTHAMINDIEDVEDIEEDEVIEVDDEGTLAVNNRLLEEDEIGNDRNFEKIVQESILSNKKVIALDISNLDRDDKKTKRYDGFQLPWKQRKKLKRNLRQHLKSKQKMNRNEADSVLNVWHLDVKERWCLYRYWVSRYCEALKMEITTKSEEYKTTCEAQKEVNLQKDRRIMADATIIAMTTTGAARYQSVLQEVNPRIIVVEEAAEVLEGHVITTLTRNCEQLILIGDHKQLRPNPNVYTLATKYNLEISLFERMLGNGVHCDCLEMQHRMRPEISKLMKPIYPTLKDHESVKSFEQVKGMSTNIYFINHGYEEEHDEEMRSHSNKYEARFVVELTDYLLKQGYSRNEITVLTTYSGQLFKLRNLMPKSRFEGVRVTAVDNYQGEENEIIILSLVRSNERDNIGFLKTENRVCVALSRARKGLYVIGNFDILSSKSPLWKEMTIMLKRSGEYGDTLLLKCQNHPSDDGIEITKPEDFRKAPAGGCQKICSARLDCGHSCVMACHPTDPFHKEYSCTKPCTKSCKEGHPCKRKCFQDCGDCETRVKKTMPLCGHQETIKCYKPVKDHKCTHSCVVVLTCGHICGNLCGFEHACKTIIKKTCPSGHVRDVSCVQQDYAECDAPCNKILECGHKCNGTCSKCHLGKLHQACKERCRKNLVCDHVCQSTCSYCPPCTRKCDNKCLHNKCKKTCGELCAQCEEPCAWRCEHYQCSRKCHQPCDRPPCNYACQKTLQKCGHDCIGLCGEPCPLKCRICHKKDVTEIFFGTEEEPDARFVQLEDCGHIIEYESMDNWMKQDTSSSSTNVVQMKACPKCKTPIRRCVRYGTIINSLLKNIEEVKQKYVGSRESVERMRVETKRTIQRLKVKFPRLRKVMESLDNREPACKCENDFVILQNQLEFLEATDVKLFIKLEKVEENLRPLSHESTTRNMDIKTAIKSFIKWLSIQRTVMGEQEIMDAQSEICRLTLMINLFHHELTAEKRMVQVPSDLKIFVERCNTLFNKGLPLTEEYVNAIKHNLKAFEKLVPASGLGISEEDKVMVINAMKLNTGHWFKCKNGHVYAIGDCGGATIEGTCPECKSAIGGSSHMLRSDNSLATVMDGAAHPAWSEQTNLANYGFDAHF